MNLQPNSNDILYNNLISNDYTDTVKRTTPLHDTNPTQIDLTHTSTPINNLNPTDSLNNYQNSNTKITNKKRNYSSKKSFRNSLHSINNINGPNDPLSMEQINIETLNIRRDYQNKLNDIDNLISMHDLDILSLTETGLHSSNKIYNKARSITNVNNNLNYNYFTLHDNTGSTKGSGTSLILKESLFNHVIAHSSFKGRVLHVDLLYRRKQMIRIISVYLPAGNSKKHQTLTTDIHNHLNSLMNTSSNYSFIILGDFNVDPKNKLPPPTTTNNEWPDDDNEEDTQHITKQHINK
ncbi:Endonuclease/exonuclease/phosphatase [Glomus cerebriforme]|uniref:Endonuclease/exonuclease/phosphatase n=1 Tax=Glomus cerebriforme TaxID=658196 RepID=A0A397T3S6_9GLOM|nr:Endonuclease/exonuclease/phosphatase [Glomus cerebriforme]